MSVDPRLLHYYNEELAHLRGAGAEFADAFPKIAGRLGMSGMKVADPYVERLLEGFSFLTARIRMRMDAEFPRFTQHLLEMVYPQFQTPTPSMLIAQVRPNLREANLARGVTLRRGQAMETPSAMHDTSPCRFTFAHDVTLWPLELVSAQFVSHAADLPIGASPAARSFKSAVRIRLKVTAGLQCGNIDLDKLTLCLSGSDSTAFALYELCSAANAGVMIGAVTAKDDATRRPRYDYLSPAHARPMGFDDQESLLMSDLRPFGFHDLDVLPQPSRSFQGYRLLQEYFAFPHRFLFVEISGLRRLLKRINGDEFEIVLLFDRAAAELESQVNEKSFSLFCVPCLNLFRHRCDPVDVNDSTHEFHIVPKRERPMDYEVHQVIAFKGHGVGVETERRFLPFYSRFDRSDDGDHAYFTMRREPRLLSQRQRQRGFRSSYVGNEVYVSLVDPREAPYSTDLRQLTHIEALCSNRDLTLQMPLGAGRTDFVLLNAAPVDSIRCVEGPTKPRGPLAEGAKSWALISQLSLNYLSLFDGAEGDARHALRQMLSLYAMASEVNARKQIDGVQTVKGRAVTRRLPMPGPIAFGRGLEIQLTLDDFAFEGASAFLFGTVMHQFFSRYVSLNSFVETHLHTVRRGEVIRWKAKCGERPTI